MRPAVGVVRWPSRRVSRVAGRSSREVTPATRPTMARPVQRAQHVRSQSSRPRRRVAVVRGGRRRRARRRELRVGLDAGRRRRRHHAAPPPRRGRCRQRTDVGSGGQRSCSPIPARASRSANGCVCRGSCASKLPLPTSSWSRTSLVDLGDRRRLGAGVHRRAVELRPRSPAAAGDDTIADSPQHRRRGDRRRRRGRRSLVDPNPACSVDVHGDWGDDDHRGRERLGVVDGDAGDDEITLTAHRPARAERPPRRRRRRRPHHGRRRTSEPPRRRLRRRRITTAGVAHRGGPQCGLRPRRVTARPDRADGVNGGAGRDVIDGGGGADAIDCGIGCDRYVVYEGDTATRCELPSPRVPA